MKEHKLMLTFLVPILLSHSLHAQTRFSLPEEIEAIALLRAVVISKDTAQIPVVLQYLKHRSDKVRAAAALTLGRLKVLEARPLLESLAQNDKWAKRAAQVALARLEAESKGKDPIEKVTVFLSVLGLTLERLNRSVQFDKFTKKLTTPHHLELLELVDMLAEMKRRGVETQTVEWQIPFEADYAASLKLQLSTMSQKQRITFLIQNILNLHGTVERYYDVQALADEGPAAVPAIISALQEIHREIKRNGFTRKGGAIGNLIGALRCIGDKRALDILRAFEAQPGIFWLPYDPEKGKPDYFVQGAARAAIKDIKEGRRYCVAWF